MTIQTDFWKDEAEEAGFEISKFKIGDGKVSFDAEVDIKQFIPSACSESQIWQIIDNTAYICQCNPKKNDFRPRLDDVDLWLTECRTDLQYVISETRKNMELSYLVLCNKFSDDLKK